MLTTAAIASLLTVATAHQNFHQFWVDGVSPGYQVGIRMPPSNSPVVSLGHFFYIRYHPSVL